MEDIYEKIKNVNTRAELFELMKNDDALKAIQRQLKLDEIAMQNDKPVSKLAVCLPSSNAKEIADRKLAKQVREYLNFTRNSYYRMIFTLRSYYYETTSEEEESDLDFDSEYRREKYVRFDYRNTFQNRQVANI